MPFTKRENFLLKLGQRGTQNHFLSSGVQGCCIISDSIPNMIKPTTISEQLLYATVRLVAPNGSTGTGFFFNFKLNNLYVPVIITNKHVINNNHKEKVNIFLHLKNQQAPDSENMNVSFDADWHFHHKQDLCFCFANPLFEYIKQIKKKEVYYIPITEELIWNNLKLEGLSAIEDVVMVGYPNGLWDQKHNLPLFRKGITATHPAIDFNNENIGAVDIACFPGSSGSPIFILNEGSYQDKGGFNVGSNRLIFLGILFAGPTTNAEGELIIENIPTQQKILPVTPLMINLGYYIKATELLAFRTLIEKFISPPAS
jgi:hypothetical protein